MKKIEIVQGILDANQATAAGNRAAFDQNECLALNIMAAPGAGKTSVLLRTIAGLGDVAIGVVEGDVVSTIDAEKVRDVAQAVVQINTKGMPESCALVADMVDAALAKLPLADLDLVLIENVGNLICPTVISTWRSSPSRSATSTLTCHSSPCPARPGRACLPGLSGWAASSTASSPQGHAAR